MTDFWLGFFAGVAALCMIGIIFGKGPKEPNYIIIKESQIVKGAP